MKIPNEILHQLHEMNCEDVAKRFGLEVKNHMAHCFKHDDRIASLSFRKNHWKCFSCDMGGDAITLIQEKFSVSFVEACVILADEYYIHIPYVETQSTKWKGSVINLRRRESANDVSCLFDREIAEFIMEHTVLTKTGIEFLWGQRKIKSDVIESSKIHSIDNANVLKNMIQTKFEIDRLKNAKVKNHMAHCFKHDDRIASLSFRKNHWKCFSCDMGGDAITLIQEKFSVSFVEACVILADEYYIHIPYVETQSTKWKGSVINLRRRESANDVSCLFDREIAEFIMEHTVLTKTGIEFLWGQRKIKSDVIESSKIHSIDNANVLKNMIQTKFEIDRLKNAKVLTSNGKYLTIDTPSLIIPYYDENNNLICLQTRYLGEDNPNFHIPRFKRICCSSIRLYNLPILKSMQPGAKIFITEGITDCLAMLSAGYNAVALPSATSFPTEDLTKLKSYNLYMVADRDKAGNDAFIKLYRLMLRSGCEVKRIELPYNVKDFCDYYLKTKKN